MKIKSTYTLEELKEVAGEQNLHIEEKDGKYRVVKTFSEQFDPAGVKAGAGYSLDRDGLRAFLISNCVDIGERLTDWREEREHKRNPEQ